MAGELPITPHTKVGALLEAYPELEEVLIAQAPAFAKLKNPVLRRTVAKVATLERIAGIGGVELRQLITVLREAVGQDAGDATAQMTEPVAPDVSDSPPPEWLEEGTVVHTFEADEMLERGESPLGPVLLKARELATGELLCIRSTFRPQPLLDALTDKLCECYCRETAPGQFETFVRAGHAGPASPAPAA